MSRAYLEFKLPEEEEEHRAAVDGLQLEFAITDLLQEFRQVIKYDGGDEVASAHAEKWRDRLLDILSSRALDWVINR